MRKTLCLILLAGILLLVAYGGAVSARPYDLEGRTVTITGFYLYEDTMADGYRAAHREWVEEEFNCRVEFVNVPWYDFVETWTSGILIGDPVADVALMEMGFGVPQLAPEGLLYPLDGVLEEDYFQSLPPSHQRYPEVYGTFLGDVYAFSANGYVWVDRDMEAHIRGIVWNKSLFEREGLPDLYDLYDAGEWTWDAMADIARRATRDTIGDGEINQWGLVPVYGGLGSWATSEMIMLAATNHAPVLEERDGYLAFVFNEEPALETIDYIYDLIHEDQAAYAGGQTALGFAQAGEAAMMVYQQHFFGYEDMLEAAEDEFGYVELPMGPEAEDHISYVYNTSKLGLSITVENPRAKIEVVNALFKLTDRYRDMDTYLYEMVWDSDRTRGAYDRKTYEIMESQLLGRWVVNQERQWRPILQQGGFQQALMDALAGETSSSAAMEGVAPQIQSLIDEVVGQ